MFFNKSLISAKSSSCVGPAGADGAGSSFFFIPLITFINENEEENKVLWSENTTDWETAIDEILNENINEF